MDLDSLLQEFSENKDLPLPIDSKRGIFATV